MKKDEDIEWAQKASDEAAELAHIREVAEGLLADNQAWALIKKVLKHDPLRDEPVEATTVEILEDFLMLIGKEQELEQMRERGSLEDTAAWLDTQLATFFSLLGELQGFFAAAAVFLVFVPEVALRTIRAPRLSAIVAAVDAAVIMNHHLENDAACLRQLAQAGPDYIGTLGPRARRGRLQEMAACEEFPVHGPVGLDIGAELPAAIALSVAAEIHAVLNARDGRSLTELNHG